jgi:hypothetical protein
MAIWKECGTVPRFALRRCAEVFCAPSRGVSVGGDGMCEGGGGRLRARSVLWAGERWSGREIRGDREERAGRNGRIIDPAPVCHLV